MKKLNWVVVLVALIIGGIVLIFLPCIPPEVITYLYFALSMVHNQWLDDRNLRVDVFD